VKKEGGVDLLAGRGKMERASPEINQSIRWGDKGKKKTQVDHLGRSTRWAGRKGSGKNTEDPQGVSGGLDWGGGKQFKVQKGFIEFELIAWIDSCHSCLDIPES